MTIDKKLHPKIHEIFLFYPSFFLFQIHSADILRNDKDLIRLFAVISYIVHSQISRRIWIFVCTKFVSHGCWREIGEYYWVKLAANQDSVQRVECVTGEMLMFRMYWLNDKQQSIQPEAHRSLRYTSAVLVVFVPSSNRWNMKHVLAASICFASMHTNNEGA